MTFWGRLKKIWSKRRHGPTPTEIESLRQDLRWSRARLAIKQLPEYTIFCEWLGDMMFSNWRDFKGNPDNVIIAETVYVILNKIENTTPEQISIDEKNLKTLQDK